MKAVFERMDGVDFVDGMDAEKTHLVGDVHFVHNVHSVHCLGKSNRLKLPNLGSKGDLTGTHPRTGGWAY